MRNTSVNEVLASKTEAEILEILDNRGVQYAIYKLHDTSGLEPATLSNAGFPTMTATSAPWGSPLFYAEGDGALYLSTGQSTVVDDFFTTNTLGDGGIILSCWVAGDDFTVQQGNQNLIGYGLGADSNQGMSIRAQAGLGGYRGYANISDGILAKNKVQSSAPFLSGSFEYFHVGMYVGASEDQIVGDLYINGLYETSTGAAAVTGPAGPSNQQNGLVLMARETGAGGITAEMTGGMYMSDAHIYRTTNNTRASIPKVMAGLGSVRGCVPDELTLL